MRPDLAERLIRSSTNGLPRGEIEGPASLRDIIPPRTQNERIHTIQQLLKAYWLFEKDVEYVVQGRQGASSWTSSPGA